MKRTTIIIIFCIANILVFTFAAVHNHNSNNIKPVPKRKAKMILSRPFIDKLDSIYHASVVPMSDSAEYHLMQGRRFDYLHDTVNTRLELKQYRYWDRKADSVLRKYHFREIVEAFNNKDIAIQ